MQLSASYFMDLESLVILPPHWFAIGAFDSAQILDRIERLVDIRDKINDEITCLKSMTQNNA